MITREFFPENFRCNLTYYEGENFSDSSLYHIFESEILGFLFSTKNSLTYGVKVTRSSYFVWVPSYVEALWYPHLYFDRKSNI